MGPDDEHLDILQNIEFAVVHECSALDDASDYDVMSALDALIAIYRNESRGHTVRPVVLSGNDAAIFDEVKAVCEWRLGREKLSELDAPAPGFEKSLDDVLTCLRKIRKSVEKWNKRGGRKGYLTFVSQYV
jgi:hypothetical protein